MAGQKAVTVFLMGTTPRERESCIYYTSVGLKEVERGRGGGIFGSSGWPKVVQALTRERDQKKNRPSEMRGRVLNTNLERGVFC